MFNNLKHGRKPAKLQKESPTECAGEGKQSTGNQEKRKINRQQHFVRKKVSDLLCNLYSVTAGETARGLSKRCHYSQTSRAKSLLDIFFIWRDILLTGSHHSPVVNTTSTSPQIPPYYLLLHLPLLFLYTCNHHHQPIYFICKKCWSQFNQTKN